jgi:hypothetical protein
LKKPSLLFLFPTILVFHSQVPTHNIFSPFSNSRTLTHNWIAIFSPFKISNISIGLNSSSHYLIRVSDFRLFFLHSTNWRRRTLEGRISGRIEDSTPLRLSRSHQIRVSWNPPFRGIHSLDLFTCYLTAFPWYQCILKIRWYLCPIVGSTFFLRWRKDSIGSGYSVFCVWNKRCPDVSSA